MALHFSDPYEQGQPEIVWASVADLAEAYWEEDGRADEDTWGVAHEFVHEQMFSGSQVAMDVLVGLVEAASSEERVVFVGCGPMEDLMSHSGNGARFIDTFEQRARTDKRFGRAASSMWLGDGVPTDVRDRLTALGAEDRSPSARD